MGLTTCKTCGHQIAAFMMLIAIVVVATFSNEGSKQTAVAAQVQAAIPKLVILKREANPPFWVSYDIQPELIDGIWPPPKKLLRFAAEDLLDKRKAEDGEYKRAFVRIYYPGRKDPLASYETENGKAKFYDYNKFDSYPTKYRILAAPDKCDKSSEHYKSAVKAAETGDPFVFVKKGGPAAMYAGCPELAIEFYTKAIECGMLKTRVEERQVGLDFSAPGEKKEPLPKKKVTINYLALAHGGRGEALCMAAAQDHNKKALRAGAFYLKKGIELAGPGEKANVWYWEKMMDGIRTLAPETLK